MLIAHLKKEWLAKSQPNPKCDCLFTNSGILIKSEDGDDKSEHLFDLKIDIADKANVKKFIDIIRLRWNIPAKTPVDVFRIGGHDSDAKKTGEYSVDYQDFINAIARQKEEYKKPYVSVKFTQEYLEERSGKRADKSMALKKLQALIDKGSLIKYYSSYRLTPKGWAEVTK